MQEAGQKHGKVSTVQHRRVLVQYNTLHYNKVQYSTVYSCTRGLVRLDEAEKLNKCMTAYTWWTLLKYLNEQESQQRS